MAKDFLPSKDALLLEWVNPFSAKLTLTPTAFGIVATQAAALAALVSSYSADLATCTNPTTRTRDTIEDKNASKALLKAEVRELARVINAFPAITNAQRLALGLNPRKSEATPSNPPTETPVLEIVEAIGRMLKVKLHAQDTNRRGKPEGVDGAYLFSFVGSAPPADISLWEFQGGTTRTTFDVQFPATVPAGSQVWLCACWRSPRDMTGPACQPITGYIAGGVVSQPQAQAA